jgi:hypothetical protein
MIETVDYLTRDIDYVSLKQYRAAKRQARKLDHKDRKACANRTTADRLHRRTTIEQAMDHAYQDGLEEMAA